MRQSLEQERLVSSKSIRVNYGIDAPTIICQWGIFGFLMLIGGIICIFTLPSGNWYSSVVPVILLVSGGCFLYPPTMILLGSLCFKFQDREWLFRQIPLEGNEKVLDVGCGHGLLLIGAAKRLDRGGRSYGLDLWSQDDQAGNSLAATMQNAALEGVAERVEIKEGDMRNMPFSDDFFDCVVSSWAIHNIYDRPGRDQALNEIIRVLKPGGRVAILDIDHGPEYESHFKSCQEKLEPGSVRRLGPRLTFGNFTYLILATKKAASNQA